MKLTFEELEVKIQSFINDTKLTKVSEKELEIKKICESSFWTYADFCNEVCRKYNQKNAILKRYQGKND